jgi:hypothetical protein
VADRVIRVTERMYYKGKQEHADTYRLSMGDGWSTWRPFDESQAAVWAVKFLSGHSPNPGYRGQKFTAWRPSRPGTDGSPKNLHYVDVKSHNIQESHPYDQGTFTPTDHDDVWIKRAWLESGFTTGERRQIYAALRHLAAAREWWCHDPDPWLTSLMQFGKGDPAGIEPIDTTGVGSCLELLRTGLVPGW